MKKKQLILAVTLATQMGIQVAAQGPGPAKQVHKDRAFLQDYSIKNVGKVGAVNQFSLASDRNGVVQILEGSQLVKPFGGYFQQNGKIVPDVTYLPMKDKKVLAIDRYQDQVVYIDDEAVFSNAWAGVLFLKHTLANPTAFAGGKDFAFVAAAKNKLQLLQQDQAPYAFELPAGINVIDIVFDASQNQFWILSSSDIYSFAPATKTLIKAVSGDKMTSLAVHTVKNQLVVGTSNGY